MSPISSKTPPSVLSTQLQFTRQPLLWFYAFWKFSRPHTIIGTSLSVLGLYLVALSSSKTWTGTSELFPLLPTPYSLLPTLLACLCGNVYIVGLNQIEDVEIDRINKPHLPLASGEFSRWQAVTIVLVMGVLAIGLAWFQGPYLLAMVSTSLILGTAYSLPPARLKRFPFLASLCIFTVRGLVVNTGLFLHFDHVREWGMQARVSGIGSREPEWILSLRHFSFSLPPAVLTLTLFILVFTFAIAIFKDIPDAEGDRKYHISTFTLKLGQRRVFNLARWVLTVAYSSLILAGLIGLPGVNSWFLVITHGLALGLFWYYSFKVDLQNKGSISHFYQFIWKLFFIEYLMFPVACLLP